jgi:hypothetical protein
MLQGGGRGKGSGSQTRRNDNGQSILPHKLLQTPSPRPPATPIPLCPHESPASLRKQKPQDMKARSINFIFQTSSFLGRAHNFSDSFLFDGKYLPSNKGQNSFCALHPLSCTFSFFTLPFPLPTNLFLYFTLQS